MTIRLHVTGVEAAKGIGKKSGNPYDMGRIFTTAQLAPPMGDGIAKGSMGLAYETVDSDVIRRVAHLGMPMDADCDIRTVMRFGKPEQMCFDLKPVSSVKP